MNLLKKHILSHLRTIVLLNVSFNKHINLNLTFVQSIISPIVMTTQMQGVGIKTGFLKVISRN